MAMRLVYLSPIVLARTLLFYESNKEIRVVRDCNAYIGFVLIKNWQLLIVGMYRYLALILVNSERMQLREIEIPRGFKNILIVFVVLLFLF